MNLPTEHLGQQALESYLYLWGAANLLPSIMEEVEARLRSDGRL